MPVLFNIDSFPTLNPAVEDALRESLRAEVEEYTSTLQGTKRKLCPFRVLSCLRYLKKHLKHHCVKNMFLADGRSPQRAVVRASFDYHNASTPLASKATVALHRLQYSAAIIEKWNSMCPLDTLHTLQKQNRPILVRVLTHSGPQYWAKSITAKFIRHSRELYYTPRFADLFLSMLPDTHIYI